MTINTHPVVADDIKSNLLEQIQKGDISAISTFYTLFKTGELDFKHSSDDLFLVDLSSLTVDELIILHTHTRWFAPTFYLRKMCYGLTSKLDDKTLLVLLEMLSPNAKKELFNRFTKNLEKASDELLVLMAQEGLDDALDVLFIRYKPFVQTTIRKMKNKAIFVIGYDNDDLVQEGILGLYKSKNDYKIDRRTKFKDFSRVVIEKHIRSLVKKSTNYKNLVLNESLSYHSPIGSDPEETFEQLLKSDTNTPDLVACNKSIFRRIRNNFTPLEKKVLAYYDEGYSYEEIGQIVGKNRKAIDNTIQRIRTKGKRFKVRFIDSASATESDKEEAGLSKLALLSHYLKNFKNVDVTPEELADNKTYELSLYVLYYTEIPYDTLLGTTNMNGEEFMALIKKIQEDLDENVVTGEFEESYTF